jgi:hypothetical protein
VKFPFFASSFSLNCNWATALPLVPIFRIIKYGRAWVRVALVRR